MKRQQEGYSLVRVRVNNISGKRLIQIDPELKRANFWYTIKKRGLRRKSQFVLTERVNCILNSEEPNQSSIGRRLTFPRQCSAGDCR